MKNPIGLWVGLLSWVLLKLSDLLFYLGDKGREFSFWIYGISIKVKYAISVPDPVEKMPTGMVEQKKDGSHQIIFLFPVGEITIKSTNVSTKITSIPKRARQAPSAPRILVPGREHNSPYDRGRADRYYGRRFNPHYYVDDERILITEETSAEFKAYEQGWIEEYEREGLDY